MTQKRPTSRRPASSRRRPSRQSKRQSSGWIYAIAALVVGALAFFFIGGEDSATRPTEVAHTSHGSLDAQSTSEVKKAPAMVAAGSMFPKTLVGQSSVSAIVTAGASTAPTLKAPTSNASVMAAVFGGPARKYMADSKTRIDPKTGKKGKGWYKVKVEKQAGTSIEDMKALSTGELIITGTLQSESAIPSSTTVYRLSKGAIGSDSCFIAKLSADGMKMDWMGVMPSNYLRPQRLAIGPKGSIYVGGQKLSALENAPEKLPKANLAKNKCAVIKVSASGKTLEWIRPGAPNQSSITGMDVDDKGRVLWTGSPSGQGQANYLMRSMPDGSESQWLETGAGKPSWTRYIHHNQPQLLAEGQYFHFYNKAKEAGKEGYDYDGTQGKWGKVRWWDFCFRLGGQVMVLPDGDLIVSSCLFYKFKEGKNKSFPAFDYFIARMNSEGKIKWSTNLYQKGDSVHTPDQKPIDMVYDAKHDKVYVAVKQHGSNVYRFKGDLYGNTGNMMIGWVGKIDPANGDLEKGWYFMNSRNSGYDETGKPKSPPYPSLAGNSLQRIDVDGDGRVYVVGSAGAKMWTSAHAWRSWPKAQNGGGQACLVVLDKDLNTLYATVVGNGQFGDAGNGNLKGLAVTKAGVFTAGHMKGTGFSTGEKPAWAAQDTKDVKASIVRFKW